MSVVASRPSRRACSMSARLAEASSGAPHLGALCETSTGMPGRAPERERLGDRLEDRLALAAYVRRVDALVAGDDPAQAQELLGAREAAGRVHEAARHAVRARTQGGVEQPLHAGELAPGDGALGEAHGGEPQSAVTDEGRDVDRVTGTAQRREVLAEGVPVPHDAVEAPAVVRPVLDGVVAMRAAQRRRRHAAVAGDVGGDTLAHGRLGLRVQKNGEVGVCVRVDEAGGHVAVGRIDHAPAAQRAGRRDHRDPVAAHGDVAAIPRVAAAVDDATPRQDEIVGGHAPSISKTA